MEAEPRAARLSDRSVGLLLILVSAFCFSTMGTIIKSAYEEGASATGMLGVRLLTATAIWGILLNRRLLAIDWRLPSIKRLLLAGAAGIALASLAEFAAYRLLPIALVVAILFMAPAWVALVQWLTAAEPIRLTGLVGLACLAVGLVLLTNASGGGASLTGIFVAVGASLGVAAVFTLAGRSIGEHDPSIAAAVLAFAAATLAIPIALLDGSFIETLSSPALFVRGLLLGVLGTVVGFFFLLNGIRRLGAFTASVASAVEPVFAGILAWLFLREALTVRQILGGALIMAGTLVVVGGQERSSGTESEADREVAHDK